MCGRYSLAVDPELLLALFDLGEIDARLVEPRYNIAPTQPIVVVNEGAKGRALLPMRWGLLPRFVQDPGTFPLIINARAEQVAERASFRYAFKYRRCLVPASGFYEWQARGKGLPKQPYLVRPADGSVMAFAGLWETWIGADGSEIDTAAIITTDANERIGAIHDRMPVVIAPEDFETWLSANGTPAQDLLALLRPVAEDALAATPISTLVNSADNDGPALWEPHRLDDDTEGSGAPGPGRRAGAAPEGQGSLF